MFSNLYFMLAYFAPTIVAFFRKHRNRWPITVGNFFLGWTGIGWIIFLILALDKEAREEEIGSLDKLEDDGIQRSKKIERKGLKQKTEASINPIYAAGAVAGLIGLLVGPKSLFFISLAAIVVCVVGLFASSDAKKLKNAKPEEVENEQLVKSENPEIDELNQVLREIRSKASAKIREYSSQALTQLSMLERRFERLTTTLNRKLNPAELTYSRYHKASKEVFNSVVVNLSISSSLMRSVDGIDSNHIEKRLEALGDITEKHEADHLEVKTLTERKKLIGQQQEKINILLTKNEVALTELDKLNAALAEMNIVAGRVPAEFDASIREMRELVGRVKLYDEAAIHWEPKKKDAQEKLKT